MKPQISLKCIMMTTESHVLAFLVFFLLLINLGSLEALHDLDCCYSYSVHLPRLKHIKNYTEQKQNEVCSMDAVIFHLKKYSVCADPKNKEVQRMISLLRKRQSKKKKPQNQKRKKKKNSRSKFRNQKRKM
ncbi:C-C motif chemokine 20-like isoform X2 [Protopterus annectens]|uniref:C-C motif chemokine 20-like isoform X2 n=1 Tax=Protopterus annectens TaxID=7888 RepID=UPI001CFC1386|nr:C-C motif chemokine 20-like isoform X2 [Protopterus annectens]